MLDLFIFKFGHLIYITAHTQGANPPLAIFPESTLTMQAQWRIRDLVEGGRELS